MCGNGNWDNNDLDNMVLAVKHSSSVRIISFFEKNSYDDIIGTRNPTVKLKIPGKAFLKSEYRISVTFKL